MNATTEVTAQNDVKGDSMNTAEKTTQFDDTIEVRGLLGLITWKNDELPHHIDLTIRTQLGEYRACITTPNEAEWVRYVYDASGRLMGESGDPVRGTSTRRWHGP